MKLLHALVIWGVAYAPLSAQVGYPIPTDAFGRLFYIQHSTNHNTYVYDANFVERGKLNQNNPIQVYRINYVNGGVRESLSAIQLRLAYGVSVTPIDGNNFQFNLVSYPDIKFMLSMGSNGTPYVKLKVNGKLILLQRVFISVRTNKLLPLKPKVEYIEFCGTDFEKRTPLLERISLADQ